MAFCRAMAATSLQRRVWVQSGSQEWWDRDVNGFSERDFSRNFRRMFVFVYDSWLLTVMMTVDLEWRERHTKFPYGLHACSDWGDLFQKARSFSDWNLRSMVAQIWFETITFFVICAVRTAIKQSYLGRTGKGGKIRFRSLGPAVWT